MIILIGEIPIPIKVPNFIKFSSPVAENFPGVPAHL